MNSVKNIIFDLGGVIINLDILATIEAFNQISEVPFESIYNQAKQNPIFNLFDKGEISEFDFFTELRKELRFEGSDEILYTAWNRMLLDVPEERLDLLVELKPQYNTFLLSNTNETHISVFERELYQNQGVRNFNDYFDKVYYSCRIGMRKPDNEIFEYVLQKNKLIPEETVFIDDSVQHVKAAGELGVRSYLLEPKMEIIDLLKDLHLL
jgi:putative hydrolase of the HAD superfamily